MNHSVCTAILGLAILLPGVSEAQVTLTPPETPRWDAAVSVGWLGVHTSDIGLDSHRWYDTASFEAGAGRYLSPHLKVEFDVAASAKASLLGFEPALVPGNPYTYPRARTHTLQATGVTGAFAYQFFENAWFHPFVGAGVAVVHETERAERLAAEPRFVDSVRPPVVLPELPPLDRSRTVAHPFLTVGFKTYATERLFFRSDLRVAASSDGAESITWRAGMGVDF